MTGSTAATTCSISASSAFSLEQRARPARPGSVAAGAAPQVSRIERRGAVGTAAACPRLRQRLVEADVDAAAAASASTSPRQVAVSPTPWPVGHDAAGCGSPDQLRCQPAAVSRAIISSSSVGTTSDRQRARHARSGRRVAGRGPRWPRRRSCRPRIPSCASTAARTGGDVLADAAGEHEGVEPAERHRQRSDRLGERGSRTPRWPAAASADRRRSAASSSVRMSLLIPESPSRPLRVLSSVEQLGQVDGRAGRPRYSSSAGVDVTAARAHHQPLQRREAHGGVDRDAVARSRAALQPLPRCTVTSRSDSSGRPSSSAARPLT